MAEKVFKKDIPPRCEYCIYGMRSGYSDEILCRKKGVTDISDSCRRYKYDPLKREPKKIKIDKDYGAKDFSLN